MLHSKKQMHRPWWLDKKIKPRDMHRTYRLLAGAKTVCRQALCPNIGECFSAGNATLLILGEVCTRDCFFCAVKNGTPAPVDRNEPARVGKTLKRLDLKYAVLTSPARDDLSDGGGRHFALCARAARGAGCAVELLIPELSGGGLEEAALSPAQVIGHNVETVQRLYSVRPGASYRRSLEILKNLKKINPALKTKSALMLGLGEKEQEVLQTIEDIRSTGCSYLSLGQYLSPSRQRFPVREYIHPGKFDFYREKALEIGFEHVNSGPYVRSSYMARSYGC